MFAAARKYRPRLSSLMQLCEANYMLLSKLLADKVEVGEQREFAVSEQLLYRLKINEVTRYTSVITLSQQQQDPADGLCRLLRPTMVVRLYHDARMAEVVSSQDVRRVKPRYDYPNANMHHPDEKQQISEFLKEWLQLCLRFGRVAHPLFDGQ